MHYRIVKWIGLVGMIGGVVFLPIGHILPDSPSRGNSLPQAYELLDDSRQEEVVIPRSVLEGVLSEYSQVKKIGRKTFENSIILNLILIALFFYVFVLGRSAGVGPKNYDDVE